MELGTAPLPLALACSRCLREGGSANWMAVLGSLAALLDGAEPALPALQAIADPQPHDWRDESGPRVGVVLYRALLQAGDLAFADALLEAMRNAGLVPRALWLSSLRDPAVQQGTADLFAREQVQAVLCTTSFASVQFSEAGMGAPLWDGLDVPVLQLLCSTQGRNSWELSSVGLAPLDLTLQIALPELDGRITTRVGAFKESTQTDSRLATALPRYQPDLERLAWVAQLIARWCELRQTPAAQRRLALVLANYPTRNSRLANGVGLDTPASAVSMLHWLDQSGYQLGPTALPTDGDALIQLLLAGRSNDPESMHRPVQAHLSLAAYEAWYQTLPGDGRQRLGAALGATSS